MPGKSLKAVLFSKTIMRLQCHIQQSKLRYYSAIMFLLILSVAHAEALVCKLRGPSGGLQGVWPGSNVTLNCSILLDGPAERITWRKNGGVLNNVSVLSSALAGSHSFLWEGLLIENLEITDAGRYSCTVLKGDVANEDWYTLNVYAKPQITHPRQLHIELNEGGSSFIYCRAKGWPKPSLVWLKGGKIFKSAGLVHDSGDELSLHIGFARQRDRGLYFCFANNTLGEDKRPLLVQVKQVELRRVLSVTTKSRHITAYEGQNVTLICDGAELLKKYTAVFWEKDGTRLGDSNRLQTRETFSGQNRMVFTLALINVSREDSGNYTCGVQTHESSDRKTMHLYIRLRVPPYVYRGKSQVFVELGSSAMLVCTAIYADDTQAKTDWTRNGSTKSLGSRRYQISQTREGETMLRFSLSIFNVSLQNLGCYTCIASTSLGWNRSWVCLWQRISKEHSAKVASSMPSSPIRTLWQATIPVLLMCVMVCVIGFIAGLFTRRRKRKRADLWNESDIQLSESFLYDVFITFSSKDFHWVKTELIPLVEKHNLIYCIHNRDFEPGRNIVDNMADSVYSSRRILAVLSENYMSSKFCRGELDMALCRNTLMKDSSLIAIRVDGIEKKKLPRALRDNTFLDYHEAKEREHWEKRLAKQLVTPSEESSLEEHLEDRDSIDIRCFNVL